MNPSTTSGYANVPPPPAFVHSWKYPRSSSDTCLGSSSSEKGSPSSSQPPTTPEVDSSPQPPANVVSSGSLLPPMERWIHMTRRTCDYAVRPHSSVTMVHPYARIYAKKRAEAGKRRKVWCHALEKSVFTQHEISTMNTPTRRSIYQASLEAYVDRIHEKLLAKKLFPVPLPDLKPWDGLNNKTAKSVIAGLQTDSALAKVKREELERTNLALRNIVHSQAQSTLHV